MKRSRWPWHTLLVALWPAFWGLAFEVVTRDGNLATRLGITHLEDLGRFVLLVSCAGVLGAIWALIEVVWARTLVWRVVAGFGLVGSAALASLGRGLL